MLLVDDEQAQILVRNVVLQQLVSADDDIDLAIANVFEGVLLLLWRTEAGCQVNGDRPVCKAVLETLVVLLSQQGSGHQDGHLLVILHGDKRGAHGDLCLAEAHVSAYQSIHGLA